MLPEGNINLRLIILKPVVRDTNYFTSLGGVMLFFFWWFTVLVCCILLQSVKHLSVLLMRKTAEETSNNLIGRWKGNV